MRYVANEIRKAAKKISTFLTDLVISGKAVVSVLSNLRIFIVSSFNSPVEDIPLSF
jgi:hypothetical protein